MPENNMKGKIFNAQEVATITLPSSNSHSPTWGDVFDAIRNQKNMSKPEPKIDIKEERVDLASIWKPESEFNKGVNDGDKIILLKLTDGRVILTDKPYEIYGADKFCRFTDFVKSFEQMQKDINELKNGGK